MDARIAKYVSLSKVDPEASDSWSQLHKDEMTRLYKLYETRDGVVTDSTIAVSVVDGVTAAEMAECFHSQELKLKWDQSIETSTLLSTKDEYCAVYHQIQKRIWPAAQRDFVYESHKQKLSETADCPDWIVCNVSCEAEVPNNYCRAQVEVVFYCQTILSGDPLIRDNIKCKIFYSSQINPGGWIPVSALKAAAVREYPKFLKNLALFAQEHVIDQKIKF